MFIEFNASDLKKWNNLTEIQKKKMINDFEVDFVVDIYISVSRNNCIFEEHKYYHVDRYFKTLLDFIEIKEINLTKTIINIDNQLIDLKINEEKEIEIGRAPYKKVIKIKVSNLKYGSSAEL